MKSTERPRTSMRPEVPADLGNADAPSTSNWDYRVMAFKEGEDAWQAIHKVHYRDDVPLMYSLGPVVVLWNADEDGEAGRRCLDRMREALDKPVLNESDFPQPSD